MRTVASVFAAVLWASQVFAVSVLPLFSTPDNPVYLRYVPAILSQATEEILLALSDLRAYSDGATDPLLDPVCLAAQRGLSVYVLVECRQPIGPDQEAALNRLRAAGANIQQDSPDVTMHAKFVVVDRRMVVVGSTHWTKTAITKNVQVDLILEAKEVAEVFRSFFFYLWEGKLQTKTKLPAPPWPEPAIIPVLDFPESTGHFQVALSFLNSAQREVILLMYHLVHYPQYLDSPSTQLLKALAEAAKRGVKIQVLVEGGESDQSLAEANRLSAAWLSTYGVEVRLDQIGPIMHAKCLIVDGRHVLVSSANWNYSSLARNVEAGILILGVPELAQVLIAHCAELWRASGAPFR